MVVREAVCIGKEQTTSFEYEEVEFVMPEIEGNSFGRMLPALSLRFFEKGDKAGGELCSDLCPS